MSGLVPTKRIRVPIPSEPEHLDQPEPEPWTAQGPYARLRRVEQASFGKLPTTFVMGLSEADVPDWLLTRATGELSQAWDVNPSLLGLHPGPPGSDTWIAPNTNQIVSGVQARHLLAVYKEQSIRSLLADITTPDGRVELQAGAIAHRRGEPVVNNPGILSVATVIDALTRSGHMSERSLEQVLGTGVSIAGLLDDPALTDEERTKRLDDFAHNLALTEGQTAGHWTMWVGAAEDAAAKGVRFDTMADLLVQYAGLPPPGSRGEAVDPEEIKRRFHISSVQQNPVREFEGTYYFFDPISGQWQVVSPEVVGELRAAAPRIVSRFAPTEQALAVGAVQALGADVQHMDTSPGSWGLPTNVATSYGGGHVSKPPSREQYAAMGFLPGPGGFDLSRPNDWWRESAKIAAKVKTDQAAWENSWVAAGLGSLGMSLDWMYRHGQGLLLRDAASVGWLLSRPFMGQDEANAGFDEMVSKAQAVEQGRTSLGKLAVSEGSLFSFLPQWSAPILDLGTAWYFDPFVVGMGAFKAYRMARYGVKSVDEALRAGRSVFTAPRLERALAEDSSTYLGRLSARSPTARNVLESMLERNKDRAERLWARSAEQVIDTPHAKLGGKPLWQWLYDQAVTVAKEGKSGTLFRRANEHLRTVMARDAIDPNLARTIEQVVNLGYTSGRSAEEVARMVRQTLMAGLGVKPLDDQFFRVIRRQLLDEATTQRMRMSVPIPDRTLVGRTDSFRLFDLQQKLAHLDEVEHVFTGGSRITDAGERQAGSFLDVLGGGEVPTGHTYGEAQTGRGIAVGDTGGRIGFVQGELPYYSAVHRAAERIRQSAFADTEAGSYIDRLLNHVPPALLPFERTFVKNIDMRARRAGVWTREEQEGFVARAAQISAVTNPDRERSMIRFIEDFTKRTWEQIRLRAGLPADIADGLWKGMLMVSDATNTNVAFGILERIRDPKTGELVLERVKTPIGETQLINQWFALDPVAMRRAIRNASGGWTQVKIGLHRLLNNVPLGEHVTEDHLLASAARSGLKTRLAEAMGKARQPAATQVERVVAPEVARAERAAFADQVFKEMTAPGAPYASRPLPGGALDSVAKTDLRARLDRYVDTGNVELLPQKELSTPQRKDAAALKARHEGTAEVAPDEEAGSLFDRDELEKAMWVMDDLAKAAVSSGAHETVDDFYNSVRPRFSDLVDEQNGIAYYKRIYEPVGRYSPQDIARRAEEHLAAHRGADLWHVVSKEGLDRYATPFLTGVHTLLDGSQVNRRDLFMQILSVLSSANPPSRQLDMAIEAFIGVTQGEPASQILDRWAIQVAKHRVAAEAGVATHVRDEVEAAWDAVDDVVGSKLIARARRDLDETDWEELFRDVPTTSPEAEGRWGTRTELHWQRNDDGSYTVHGWHGTDRGGLPNDDVPRGVHVGTYKAAVDRLSMRGIIQHPAQPGAPSTIPAIAEPTLQESMDEVGLWLENSEYSVDQVIDMVKAGDPEIPSDVTKMVADALDNPNLDTEEAVDWLHALADSDHGLAYEPPDTFAGEAVSEMLQPGEQLPPGPAELALDWAHNMAKADGFHPGTAEYQTAVQQHFEQQLQTELELAGESLPGAPPTSVPGTKPDGPFVPTRMPGGAMLPLHEQPGRVRVLPVSFHLENPLGSPWDALSDAEANTRAMAVAEEGIHDGIFYRNEVEGEVLGRQSLSAIVFRNGKALHLRLNTGNPLPSVRTMLEDIVSGSRKIGELDYKTQQMFIQPELVDRGLKRDRFVRDPNAPTRTFHEGQRALVDWGPGMPGHHNQAELMRVPISELLEAHPSHFDAVHGPGAYPILHADPSEIAAAGDVRPPVVQLQGSKLGGTTHDDSQLIVDALQRGDEDVLVWRHDHNPHKTYEEDVDDAVGAIRNRLVYTGMDKWPDLYTGEHLPLFAQKRMKVHAMYRLLHDGDDQAMMIDRWIARGFGFSGKGEIPAGDFRQIEDAVRLVAKQNGWSPGQAQSVLWDMFKNEHADMLQSTAADLRVAADRFEVAADPRIDEATMAPIDLGPMYEATGRDPMWQSLRPEHVLTTWGIPTVGHFPGVTMHSLIEDGRRMGDIAIWADESGRARGYLTHYKQVPEGSPISEIGVEPEFRAQGIPQQMAEQLVDHLGIRMSDLVEAGLHGGGFTEAGARMLKREALADGNAAWERVRNHPARKQLFGKRMPNRNDPAALRKLANSLSRQAKKARDARDMKELIESGDVFENGLTQRMARLRALAPREKGQVGELTWLTQDKLDKFRKRNEMGKTLAMTELGDQRARMTIYQGGGDWLTVTHEMGHYMRSMLTDADLDLLEHYLGVQRQTRRVFSAPGQVLFHSKPEGVDMGARVRDTSRWPMEAEEKFAEGLENFANYAIAPPELTGVFRQIMGWLKRGYQRLQGNPELRAEMGLTPELEAFWKRMFDGSRYAKHPLVAVPRLTPEEMVLHGGEFARELFTRTLGSEGYLAIWKPAMVIRLGYIFRVPFFDETIRNLADVGLLNRMKAGTRSAQVLTHASNAGLVPKGWVETVHELPMQDGGTFALRQPLPGMLPHELYADSRTKHFGEIYQSFGEEQKRVQKGLADGYGLVDPPGPKPPSFGLRSRREDKAWSHYFRSWTDAVNGHLAMGAFGHEALFHISEGMTREQSIDELLRLLGSGDRAFTSAAKRIGIDELSPEELRTWMGTTVDMARRYTLGDRKLAFAAMRREADPGMLATVINEAAAHGEELTLPSVHGMQAAVQSGRMNPLKDAVDFMAKWILQEPTNRLNRQPFFKAWYSMMMEMQMRLAKAGGAMPLDTREAEMVVKQMQRQAREFAINRTQRILFDFRDQSRLAEMMSFVAPFFQPFAEAISVYSQLIRKNPMLIPYARVLWKYANDQGIVRKDPDTGQNVVPLSNFFFMAPILSAVYGHENMPGFSLSAPLSSFNLFFNNAIPFATPFNIAGTVNIPLPGFAPPVQWLIQAYLNWRDPNHDSKLTAWAFQYGPIGIHSLFPTYVNNIINALSGGKWNPDQSAAYVDDFEALAIAQGTAPLKEDGQIDYERLREMANKQAGIFYGFKSFISWAFPAGPTTDFPTVELSREFRDLQANPKYGPLGARDEFIRRHPEPGMGIFTIAKTMWDKTDPGLPTKFSVPSIPANEIADKVLSTPGFKEFAARFPALAWAVLPPAAFASGEYDPDIFRKQVALIQRSYKDPTAYAKEGRAAEGWVSYFHLREGWEARQQAFIDQGIPETAPEWIAAKNDFDAGVTQLQRTNFEWDTEFGAAIDLKIDPNVLAYLRKARSDEVLRDFPVGKALDEYFTGRDAIEKEMKRLGIGSIDSQSAIDTGLAQQYTDLVGDPEKNTGLMADPDFERLYQMFLGDDLMGLKSNASVKINGIPPELKDRVYGWGRDYADILDRIQIAGSDTDRALLFQQERDMVNRAYADYPEEWNPAILQYDALGYDMKRRRAMSVMTKPYEFLDQLERSYILGDATSASAEQIWAQVGDARIQIGQAQDANPDFDSAAAYAQLDEWVQGKAESDPTFAAQLANANTWGYSFFKISGFTNGDSPSADSWRAVQSAMVQIQDWADQNDMHGDIGFDETKKFAWTDAKKQLYSYIQQLAGSDTTFAGQIEYLERNTRSDLIDVFMPEVYFPLGGVRSVG